MRFITTVAYLASLAWADPLVKRDGSSLLCMYMTVDAYWSGEGLNLCEYPGVCANKLPDGLSQQVSSAGPQQGATCYLYSGQYCQGQASNALVYPGSANLAEFGFNDEAMSWMCYSS